MTNIADNITRLMNAEGISASDLSRKTGVDRSVLHKILCGTTKNPSIESIKTIINHYSFEEVVLGTKSATANEVPVITWLEAANLTPDMLYLHHKKVKIGCLISKTAFAVLIEYTMDSRFPEGTLLIVDREKRPKNLSYIIVKEGENEIASLKRFILDGSTPYLKSIDPSIPSIRFDPELFKVIGVVIQSIFDFE